MDKEKVVNTLKKATDKGLEVGKQAVTSVKDTTKAVINEEKEKYHENQAKGIDNFDDKLKKWLVSISPTATIAKWRMNRVMNGYRKEEDEEKGISTESNFSLVFQIFSKFGIGGYIAFFGILVVIVLMILNYLLDLIPYIPFFLLLKYIHIHYKYSRNGKHFDWYWFIDLIKEDYSYRPESISDTYYTIPLALYLTDNELENYLEKRGKKDMVSKQREYASISNSRIEFDKKYGWIRIFQIDNRFFKKSVNSLEDVELTDYFIIPQCTSNHELNNQVYYAVHNEVKQSISHLIGMESIENFISKIVNDSNINAGFDEIAEQLEEQRQKEIEEEKARKEQIELEQLEQQISQKGLNKEVATILKTIREKRDEWNFGVWNSNDNLTGNSSYFKVRCILRNSKTLSDIKKIQHIIESDFRHTIVLNERQDKRAFDLTVILKPQLTSFEMKCKDLLEYSKNKLIYIGKSYTGDLVTEWNYQANHIVIAGKSGSGKSEAIREILLQLSRLDEGGTDFDYKTMFLTSSSKIGDFADFGKMGALVKSGIDNQIQIFSFILQMLEEREEIFYKSSVQNIQQFNEKYPEKRMKQLVLLADEYENTRGDLDKKKAQEAESLMVSILNIARSSGCVVIIGAQSILKQDIGTIKDKMTIRFSGKNETNVLNTIDTSIANYYKSYRGKPQGVFMYQADNLEISGDYITQGDTSFTLIQTPYISDISVKTLPKLSGAEFEQEIFSKNISTENFEEEEELGVDPY